MQRCTPGHGKLNQLAAANSTNPIFSVAALTSALRSMRSACCRAQGSRLASYC
jgi:hypothetical protein